MKYSELSEQEKRIWDYVYALTYFNHNGNYELAFDKASSSIYGLRIQQKKQHNV